MTHPRLILPPLVLAALVAAVTVRADPRWWWNDVRVTNNAGASVTPHLAPIRYNTNVAGLVNTIFVTWSDETDGRGDTEIWFTASFNGGCSFCPPMRITDNDVDDTRPRVAIIVTPAGMFSLAIAFESNGQAVIAWDSAHASGLVPADQLCAEVAKMAPAIIAGDQYVRFGAPPGITDHPDVVGVSMPGNGHFHAVFRQEAAGSSRIFGVRDLTTRGGVGWTADPPRMIPGPLDNFLTQDFEPALAGDSLTSPDPVTGLPVVGHSAVNVVFVESTEVGPSQRVSVVSARSVDSGTTYSPTGMTTDAPGEGISDPLVGPPPAHPEIDTTYRGFSSSLPAWVATAWDDYRSFSGVPEIWTDGRHFDLPATPSPDWNAPDVQVSAADEGGPAIALEFPPRGTAARAWLGWTDSSSGAREIHCRGGLLDPTAPTFLDYSRFPFDAMRSLDPVASANFQLSACVFDEATFDCLPSRTAGDASKPDISANETGTYAVWVDTRDGNSEIYFKRTDGWIQINTPRLATGCDPDGSAWIEVTFDEPPTCGSGAGIEKMLRYRIYWAMQSNGPYDIIRGPIDVAHDDAVGTVTRRIPGLVAATTYYVIVVPEDEARNVMPPAFDPAVQQLGVLSNQASIATPDPCLLPTCLWRSDVTSLLPHTPPRLAVYLVPPSGQDISLQGAPYQCPFATDDLEQDVNALDNGVALSLYQVNLAIPTLRLSKSGTTIRFEF